ncbi:MAG: rhodanese-like domain-containing protein [Proteobacteria bacterium]|nr:rhodanese-like domain-containing protein [Pseudomonadota bacterium]
MAEGYAGDVTPKEAWDILEKDEKAVLVDCRTAAEWNYVGVPDVSGLGKNVVCAEWITFPGGAPNGDFVSEVTSAGIDKHTTVLFLCRSGQRSIAAAIALTEAGYGKSYNILEGFEGNKDDSGHRGKTGGWKVTGLPWTQG